MANHGCCTAFFILYSLNKGSIVICTFQLKQCDLLVDPSSVSSQTSICTNNSMAGNDNRYFIVSNRPSDSLCRHRGNPLFCGKLLCDFTICYRLSVWNLQ